MRREYPLRPIIGIGAIIVCDGRILMVKRGSEPGKGKWSVPGGIVELGETVRETVVREVKEECGLDVETDGLIDVVDNIIRDENGKIRYHFVILDFFVKVKGGTLKLDEVLDARWVPLEEAEKYDLTKTFRAFLQRNRDLLKKFNSCS